MGMEISSMLSSEFCVDALREAVQRHGIPEVMHTDRGKQFVGKEFAELLKEKKIKLSVSERVQRKLADREGLEDVQV